MACTPTATIFTKAAAVRLDDSGGGELRHDRQRVVGNVRRQSPLDEISSLVKGIHPPPIASLLREHSFVSTPAPSLAHTTTSSPTPATALNHMPAGTSSLASSVVSDSEVHSLTTQPPTPGPRSNIPTSTPAPTRVSNSTFIGVSAALGCIIIFAITLLLYRRRRRRAADIFPGGPRPFPLSPDAPSRADAKPVAMDLENARLRAALDAVVHRLNAIEDETLHGDSPPPYRSVS